MSRWGESGQNNNWPTISPTAWQHKGLHCSRWPEMSKEKKRYDRSVREGASGNCASRQRDGGGFVFRLQLSWYFWLIVFYWCRLMDCVGFCQSNHTVTRIPTHTHTPRSSEARLCRGLGSRAVTDRLRLFIHTYGHPAGWEDLPLHVSQSRPVVRWRGHVELTVDYWQTVTRPLFRFPTVITLTGFVLGLQEAFYGNQWKPISAGAVVTWLWQEVGKECSLWLAFLFGPTTAMLASPWKLVLYCEI